MPRYVVVAYVDGTFKKEDVSYQKEGKSGVIHVDEFYARVFDVSRRDPMRSEELGHFYPYSDERWFPAGGRRFAPGFYAIHVPLKALDKSRSMMENAYDRFEVTPISREQVYAYFTACAGFLPGGKRVNSGVTVVTPINDFREEPEEEAL